MTDELRVVVCGGGAYRRLTDGRWHYRWLAPVPGARDLVVREVDAVGGDALAAAELLGRVLTADERALLHLPEERPPAHDPRWRQRAALVLGIQAPELHPAALLDVEQLAVLLDVTRPTVDAYRSRGLLPMPQLHRGRTPLWAPPVVHRWLRSRPSRLRRASRPVAVGR